MSAEREHILTVKDGLRYVDVFHDFTSHEELATYLDQCQLIGVGCDALAFVVTEADGSLSESLIRIDIFNSAGYSWTKALLVRIKEKYHWFTKKVEYLERKLNQLEHGEDSYKRKTKKKKREQKHRIAAHNSLFRHDPTITMPINSYYTLRGELLGLRIKYLAGQPLACIDPDAVLPDNVKEVFQDDNLSNVLVQIINSCFTSALIDIEKFRPSDQWPKIQL